MGALKKQTKELLSAVGLYETVFKLWRCRPNLRVSCLNAGYRFAGASDRLPIPPTHLICLVAPSGTIARYLYGGKAGQESILYALNRNGVSIEKLDAILDFGCGCGRIIRHWHALEGPRLYGTDYNADMVCWCKKKLNRLAEFKTNNLAPPTEYTNEQFDFVYAISVFTHLNEELQHAWINELERVLTPGGFLLITVHGESRFYELTPKEQQRFRSGQLVIRQESAVGTNLCGAYHPERYVRDHLVKPLEVLDFIPNGARDVNQDIFLLRKPAIPTRQ